MTKLDKPLAREVDVSGTTIIVTLVPEDAGIGAHIKFRRKGEHKAFRSLYIEAPISAELERR